MDKIIDEGREYLKKLRAADDAIPDETLSEDITRMERASADIFRYIADHPGEGPANPQIHELLPATTLKLLGSYQRLSAQNVKGENITSTLFNIAGMMHTVLTPLKSSWIPSMPRRPWTSPRTSPCLRPF